MSHARRTERTLDQPLRIISGGQSGVDRAALDVAMALGIPHGGWCPQGRRAEDGRIPRRYGLRETESPDYFVRTERNVLDADATLIIHAGPMTGGTELTLRMCRKHRKPCFLIDLEQSRKPSLRSFQQWIDDERIAILNVAGPRESTSPGIYHRSTTILQRLLTPRSPVQSPE